MACLPSLLSFIFEAKAWTGRGGGGAIRESTGRDLAITNDAKSDSAKSGGRPAASARPYGKISTLLFREARRCPRAPVVAGN